MSENANPKDPSIQRIESIGTHRDALRATVAALSAREAYEKTMETMGSARPNSPVEAAFRELTLSQSRKTWEGAMKALEMSKDDYIAATQACPLPTAPETQIEGHVMREAAVAQRSLDNALAGRKDIRPEQPLEEVIGAVLAQQPIAEPEMDRTGFVGRVGGRAIHGIF